RLYPPFRGRREIALPFLTGSWQSQLHRRWLSAHLPSGADNAFAPFSGGDAGQSPAEGVVGLVVRPLQVDTNGARPCYDSSRFPPLREAHLCAGERVARRRRDGGEVYPPSLRNHPRYGKLSDRYAGSLPAHDEYPERSPYP